VGFGVWGLSFGGMVLAMRRRGGSVMGMLVVSRLGVVDPGVIEMRDVVGMGRVFARLFVPQFRARRNRRLGIEPRRRDFRRGGRCVGGDYRVAVVGNVVGVVMVAKTFMIKTFMIMAFVVVMIGASLVMFVMLAIVRVAVVTFAIMVMVVIMLVIVRLGLRCQRRV
jgi:hypothetical protein